MKDAMQIRLWTLLVHVRRLRVERRRRLLKEARLRVERAAADTAGQKQAIEHHDAKRGGILAACKNGNAAAMLWRMALRRHDDDRFPLEDALSRALHVERQAQAEAERASRALQREMLGEDDARTRVRGLKAAQHCDDDPDA
ncbi:hypothetical protein [Paraburkholderia azotifigens]|uniref:Type III secretion protein n=2 Tax=Paraburkholderia azotifigens TaxID=2057004 RepID=A0ABU9R6R0_9BURK